MTAIGFACTLGIAFGAIQQMPQIVPGLAEVQAGVKEARPKRQSPRPKRKGETEADKLKAIAGGRRTAIGRKLASEYTKMQEIGGLIGPVLDRDGAGCRGVSLGHDAANVSDSRLDFHGLLFWFFLRVAEHDVLRNSAGDAFIWARIPVTTMSMGIFLVGLVYRGSA